MNMVTIVIPTFNRCDQLHACLQSICRIEYDELEVIVVDDCSTDNTVTNVKLEFPHVTIVELQTNSGVSHARNIGLKYASGEYICFIDSDNVVTNDLIKELVEVFEKDSNIGFAGPKMYYLKCPKKIWYAGSDINLITSRTYFYRSNELDSNHAEDKVIDVMQIPNVWMVKREVVDKIGGIDESYVMHYEESDWSLRVIKAGYRVVYCPRAIVYHDVPLSYSVSDTISNRDNGRIVYYYARNRVLFMNKHSSLPAFIIFLIIFNNVFALFYAYVYIKKGKIGLVNWYFSGYFAAYKILIQKLLKKIFT